MKDKLLELLVEIKQVCELQDIPFFLSGELAFHAFKERELRKKFSNATILIYAADVERFSKAIMQNKKGRALEHLGNNPNFPGFYLRYTDTGTTLIRYNDTRFNFVNNCIGVDIGIICYKRGNGIKGKLLRYLKSTWLRIFRTEQPGRANISVPRRVINSCGKVFFKVFKSSAFMKSLFWSWIKEGSIPAAQCTVALNNNKQLTFDSMIFKNVTYLNVEGEAYPLPFETRSLVRPIFNAEEKKFRSYEGMIFNTEVPWEQYQRSLQEKKISLKKVQKKRIRYLKWRKKHYLPYLQKRTYYYSIIFCSEDRVRFWREYKGEKKKLVQQLYAQECYEELHEEMGEYLKKLKSYRTKNIGLCFDREILEIAIKLLIRDASEEAMTTTGFGERCEKVLKIVNDVPYQHFDDIENSFMGVRSDKAILKEQKSSLYNEIMRFYEEFPFVEEEGGQP